MGGEKGKRNECGPREGKGMGKEWEVGRVREGVRTQTEKGRSEDPDREGKE